MSSQGSLKSSSNDSISTESNSIGGVNFGSTASSLFQTPSRVSYYHAGFAHKNFNRLMEYRLAEKMCDVTLVAGPNGKKIAAHK